MAQLIVRNLDQEIKAALKRRAMAHGCSMEEEIRRILRVAISQESSAGRGLGSRIAQRFSTEPLDQRIPELRGEEAKPMSLPED